jgi:hypothetical protein
LRSDPTHAGGDGGGEVGGEIFSLDLGIGRVDGMSSPRISSSVTSVIGFNIFVVHLEFSLPKRMIRVSIGTQSGSKHWTSVTRIWMSPISGERRDSIFFVMCFTRDRLEGFCFTKFRFSILPQLVHDFLTLNIDWGRKWMQ